MRAALIALLFACAPACASLACYDASGGHATWMVGQPVSALWDSVDTGAVWVECYASGKELAYVQSHFTGLRSRTLPQIDGTNGIYWDGDDAIFIVNNL